MFLDGKILDNSFSLPGAKAAFLFSVLRLPPRSAGDGGGRLAPRGHWFKHV